MSTYAIFLFLVTYHNTGHLGRLISQRLVSLSVRIGLEPLSVFMNIQGGEEKIIMPIIHMIG